MEALAGFVRQLGKVLEADRSVYKIAEDKASRIRFAAEKKSGRFIEKRLNGFRIALNFFSTTVCLKSRVSVMLSSLF